jgi:uncharacterized protein YjbI with pentapeptide repeats
MVTDDRLQVDKLKKRIAELEQKIEELEQYKSYTRSQEYFKGNKTQLRMILEASDRDDVTLWNNWRKNNPDVQPDLRHACFDECRLYGINLDNAILTGASFDGAHLLKATFNGARLTNSSFNFVYAYGAEFKNAKCNNVAFERADLKETDFTSATLQKTEFRNADLEKARMREVNLKGAQMEYTILKSADLSTSNMEEIDLDNSNLEESNLTEVRMYNADARGVNFSGAVLRGADLRKTEFTGANLSSADLRGADIRDALVQGANVSDVIYDSNTNQRDLRYEIWHPGVGDFYDITFGNIEMTHLISLFLQNPKWENIFNVSTSKLVLILGRFADPARYKVLEGLRQELLTYDYLPVVFDFDEPTGRDTVEVVATLAGLSRFIICDLTQQKSTPLESHVIIPNLSIPFVPIIQKGEQEFSMFRALKKYEWVLPTVEYSSKKQLFSHLNDAILKPAEKKIRYLVNRKSAEEAKPISIEKYVK